MTDYIQFTTEDGATILVEAAAEADTYQSGVIRAGLKDKAGETIAQAKASFEEGLEVIRYNARAFIKKVRDLPDPPDEMDVTFGLKATGEVGNFAVAKVGTEASYTVKLTWKREEKKARKSPRGTSRHSY
jgi:hypothetical protein